MERKLTVALSATTSWPIRPLKLVQLLKNVRKTCKNGEGLFANDVEYSCSDDGTSYCVTKFELNLFYEKVGFVRVNLLE